MTDPIEIAAQLERACNVLQKIASSDILFSAPTAAPGCELTFTTLRQVIAALRLKPALEMRVGETFNAVCHRLMDATLAAIPKKRRAAEVLGVSTKTLYNMRKRPEFRHALTAHCPKRAELAALARAEAEANGYSCQRPAGCVFSNCQCPPK